MNKLKNLRNNDKSSLNKKGSIGIIFIAVFVILAIGSLSYIVTYSLTTGYETISIKDKWVKYNNEDAKYLVSSEDGQVFQITDSYIKWRFDSSNVYADLDKGETYNIKTQGWRFAFLSSYKNILEVELIE